MKFVMRNSYIQIGLPKLCYVAVPGVLLSPEIFCSEISRYKSSPNSKRFAESRVIFCLIVSLKRTNMNYQTPIKFRIGQTENSP